MVSWAQRLPDILTLCCTPGVFFLLSETYNHKYKTFYFSMIPPSPKHAVLLSRGVSFGGSLCFTGCKLQHKMKIFRGCSWFPTVWHTAGQTSWGFQTCPCLPVLCNQRCSSGAEPPHSGIPWGALLVSSGGNRVRLSSHLSHCRGLMGVNDKHRAPLVLLTQMSHYDNQEQAIPHLARTMSWHRDLG